jgi:heat shock protein HslJ
VAGAEELADPQRAAHNPPMSIARAVLIGMLAAGVVPATRAAQDPAPAPLESLTGTEWTIVELGGARVTATAGPRAPHLAFLANGKVGGSDGCNRLSGAYTATPPDGLVFGPTASTRMACPGVEDVGARLASAMKGTSHWRIVSDRLQLLGATGQPLAVLEPRAPIPAADAKVGSPPKKVRGTPPAKPVKP